MEGRQSPDDPLEVELDSRGLTLCSVSFRA